LFIKKPLIQDFGSMEKSVAKNNLYLVGKEKQKMFNWLSV